MFIDLIDFHKIYIIKKKKNWRNFLDKIYFLFCLRWYVEKSSGHFSFRDTLVILNLLKKLTTKWNLIKFSAFINKIMNLFTIKKKKKHYYVGTPYLV